MSRKNLFCLVLLGGSVLLAGCGPSDSGNTEVVVAPTATPIVTTGVDPVDDTTLELVEAVVTGPDCAYGLLMSPDVQHRLNHYRICVPKAGEEQKQADALQEALDDCFSACDTSFPDENGSKVQGNLDCVAQCKGE